MLLLLRAREQPFRRNGRAPTHIDPMLAWRRCTRTSARGGRGPAPAAATAGGTSSPSRTPWRTCSPDPAPTRVCIILLLLAASQPTKRPAKAHRSALFDDSGHIRAPTRTTGWCVRVVWRATAGHGTCATDSNQGRKTCDKAPASSACDVFSVS